MKFRTTQEIATALATRFADLGVAEAGEVVSLGVPMVCVEIPNADVALEVVDFLCETKMKGYIRLIELIMDGALYSRASEFTHYV